MEIETLRKLRSRLSAFVRQFDGCVKTAPSRRHLRTYVQGQLSDLERKSIASMALNAEVAPRTLQEFLEVKRWDHEAVRQRLQQLVMAKHADPHAIGVIDETSFAKKGNKTLGVQHQHCGSTGKTENCTVTVHLGYVAKDFHALVDSDIYLPKSWVNDADRCREAGLPAGTPYRGKWQIALELLSRSLANGVKLSYLTADEEYGRCNEFRRQVAAMELLYVVEVPSVISGWTNSPPQVETVVKRTPEGQAVCRIRCVRGSAKPCQLQRLWKQGGPPWRTFHVKDTDKGPVVWDARLCRFWPREDGPPGPEGWLIMARNVLTGEVKYFLSNAPAETELAALLNIAFSRVHIELLFEECKGQVGMDHFEVRHYQPLLRHLIISMVSLLFLAEQTQHLRGEKPLLDDRSDSTGHRSTTRSQNNPLGTNAPSDQGGTQHRVLAAVQSKGKALSPSKTSPSATRSGHQDRSVA